MLNGAAPSFRRSDDSEQLLSVGGGVISLPSFPRKEQLFRSLNGFTIIIGLGRKHVTCISYVLEKT